MSASDLWRASEPPLLIPPDNWNRMVVMDYGGSAPKATTYWAIHPRWACAVIYGEWYQREKLIKEQVAAAYTFLGQKHALSKNTTWIVDRSAPLQEYMDAGAPVQPSLNIPNAKQELEAATERLLGSGRVLVLRPATDILQKETARIVWKPSPDKPFSNARDARVERDDHAFDTMVYGCGYLATRLEGDLDEKPEVVLDPWDSKQWAQPSKPDLGAAPKTDVAALVSGLLGM